MLFERIESEGLAHYSYLLGSGGEAIVIDPRRDCDIYVELAQRQGYRITHILETHRNEDYLIGSRSWRRARAPKSGMPIATHPTSMGGRYETSRPGMWGPGWCARSMPLGTPPG